MNYLITGHNGFIGQHYVHHLLKNNQNLNVLGISRSGCVKCHINEVKVDLLDSKLTDVFKEFHPDVVIHFASTRFGDLNDLFLSNVKATENLLNTVLNIERPIRVILIGSSAEIGIPYQSPSSELDPCNPIDYYGLTKLMQSQLAYQYYIKHNMDVVRLRLFNVLGPTMPPTLLAGKAIKEIKNKIALGNSEPIVFGDLSSYRDYVDLRDLCRAIDKSILYGNPGELYNIGSGKKIQGKELINKILNECPLQTDLIHFETKNANRSLVKAQAANTTKAKTQLNWEPTFNLHETISWIWNSVLNGE